MDELVSLGILEGGLPAQAMPGEFHNSASAADDVRYFIEHRSRIPVLRPEMRSQNLLPKTTPTSCPLLVGDLV